MSLLGIDDEVGVGVERGRFLLRAGFVVQRVGLVGVMGTIGEARVALAHGAVGD